MAVELKGSPKQISWAKSIRTDRMSKWKKADPVAFQHIQSSLENEFSASWWITHREKELKDVLPFIVEGGEKKVGVKAAKEVSVVPEAAFSGLDAIVYRMVGELKDVVTGAVVVDPGCPF